jgi:RNA polymerase primary sigma factor
MGLVTRPTASPTAQAALSRLAAKHVAKALALSGAALTKSGRERTSALALDRLAAALAAPLPTNTERARPIQQARAELRCAEQLWWELALSADYIAVSEANKRSGPMPLEDRIQEGRLGLYRAARIFEPRPNGRGGTIRFATHARWWVRAAISRAIDRTGGAIAISSWSSAILLEYRSLPAGTSITDAARILGRPRDAIELVLSAMAVGSLDEPIAGMDGSIGARPIDLLESPPTDPAGDMDDAAQRRAVEQALAALPDRQHRAVTRYLRGETLSDVARGMGISRERARQIESDGLARLHVALAVEARPGRRDPASGNVGTRLPVERARWAGGAP